jgi:cytochrome c peroxidase
VSGFPSRFRALALALGLTTAGALVAGCGDDESNPACPDGFCPEPYELDTAGLPDSWTIPEDNPLTVPGIALGRKLFHDPVLSGNGTMACATCHAQATAFADPRRVSPGSEGGEGTRNAPALINLAWNDGFFWDGRAHSIEDQAREPVPNPIEMNLPWDQAIPRLAAHAEYPALFRAAFGTDAITEDLVVKAIAQFERTLVSKSSPYDRFLNQGEPLSEAAHRGFTLFFSEEGDCFHCHGTRLFTDNEFHNNGLDAVPADPGLEALTGDPLDRGRFRTPTLRNVEYTAPYMHDGRFATLEEVVDHYSEGIQPSPSLDPVLGVHQGGGVSLTADQKADLIAFLKSLSDPGFLTNPEFGPPAR